MSLRPKVSVLLWTQEQRGSCTRTRFFGSFKMGIGELNARISFCRVGKDRDAGGGTGKVFTIYKTTWAAVRPVSKYLHMLGGGENFTTKKMFIVRFDSQINQMMVIQFPVSSKEENFYTIKEIDNVGEGSLYMEITAEKYGVS